MRESLVQPCPHFWIRLLGCEVCKPDKIVLVCLIHVLWRNYSLRWCFFFFLVPGRSWICRCSNLFSVCCLIWGDGMEKCFGLNTQLFCLMDRHHHNNIATMLYQGAKKQVCFWSSAESTLHMGHIIYTRPGNCTHEAGCVCRRVSDPWVTSLSYAVVMFSRPIQS